MYKIRKKIERQTKIDHNRFYSFLHVMTLISSYITISLGLIIVRRFLLAGFLPLNFFLSYVSKIIDKLTLNI